MKTIDYLHKIRIKLCSPRLFHNKSNILIFFVFVLVLVIHSLYYYIDNYVDVSLPGLEPSIESATWIKIWGGFGRDLASSIAIDGSNTIYTTGLVSGIADMQPGFGVSYLGSRGGSLCYLIKFDATGSWKWAKQIFSRSVYNPAISSGFNNNVFITSLDLPITIVNNHGSIQALANDIGKGEAILVSPEGYIYLSGHSNSLMKYDSSLKLVWRWEPGGNCLALDNENYIYTATTTLFKLSERGQNIWSRDLPGWAMDIAVCQDGNVVVTGLEHSNDDGVDGFQQPSRSRFGNSFIIKFDSNGNSKWIRIWRAEVNSVAVSTDGNIFVTGGFAAPVDFDPGPGEYIPSHPDERSLAIFLSKFDSEGNFKYVHVGSEPYSFGYDVAVDNLGNVYLAGMTKGDAFLAKFTE